jgi:uncharacterized membrane protein YebE (DUF533 family)
MGIARRRMRRRVLVAGAATGAVAYHAGKKHQQNQQDQYDDQQEPEQTDYAPAPPADSGPDASDLDQIAKLADLHKSGALTDEEFAVAKSKLLA